MQPGASRTGFDGRHGERLKVKLRERAVDGAADLSLCGVAEELAV